METNENFHANAAQRSVNGAVLFLLMLLIALPTKADAIGGREEKKPVESTAVSPTRQVEHVNQVRVTRQLPEFPGGLEELNKHFQQSMKHLKTPKREAVIQGQVTCLFFVKKDGSVEGAEIVKGLASLWDEAILHAISEMPRWHSGIAEIRVKLVLSVVSFELGDSSPVIVFHYTTLKGSEEEEIVDKNDGRVEEPEFPGGSEALVKYLQRSLHYPPDALRKKIKGRVVCQFIVDREGKITDITILQGVHPSLDKEALRVIRAMPKWKPGTMDGKLAKVRYTLPISFYAQ